MSKMPKWNNPMSDLDLIKALSWFHAYSNETKTKRYIKDYIQMFKSSLIPHLKNLNEYVIQDVSCAYIAHLITEGYDIPQSAKKKFTDTRYLEQFTKNLEGFDAYWDKLSKDGKMPIPIANPIQ